MSEPLWSLSEIAHACGAETAGGGATPVAGISIDSRSLQPGEAFIAIRGERNDGHAFVAAALDAGASCAIVERDFPHKLPEVRLLRVDDTMQALNRLGAAGRERAGNATIIGVTGSVGKTGTKEALKLALAPSGAVHASAKSHNNHWGVPLSLANMPRHTRFGVFEAGMNHVGELVALSKAIRPHIAIVTTVEPVHLGFFPSVEAIAEAKAEIFAGLEPDGTAILNRDNPHFDRLAARAREAGAKILTFGRAADADAKLLDASLGCDESDVSALIGGVTVHYRLGAPGAHLVQNSLAVLAAAHAAGADLEAAAKALVQLRPQTGRGERLVLRMDDGTLTVIDESYNANPASMRAALATLGQIPRASYPRRVAVLGDMLELGAESAELHRNLAAPIGAAGVDLVLVCGEHMAALYEALPGRLRGGYAKDAEALLPALLATARPGDALIIKGSFGSRMGPLVEALRRQFGEAGEAA